MKNKFVFLLVVVLMVSVVLVGCSGDQKEDAQQSSEEASTSEEAISGDIIVVSREDGSGTRGAFVEITGVEKDKEDRTTVEALIQNGTNAVMTTVSGDKQSIGYISLGSLNDTVKALMIDGAEATAEEIAAGNYPLQRPFNIAWKGDLSDLGKDFVAFIHSTEGQNIVAENGYIKSKSEEVQYSATGMKGTLNVVGSTSVSPLMEKMKEAYEALNPDVEINITSNGSTAGMTSAIDGTADIGMASRELKDEESSQLEHDAIAIDGIAVVVNKENSTSNLTMEQVMKIYIGEITKWDDIK